MIAEELGWTPDILKTRGDFYQIAQYYYLVKHGRISGLRSKLDKLFHDQKIDLNTSKAHSLLVDLEAPIIYTTNWDQWIEKIFEEKGKDFRSIRDIYDIYDFRKLKKNITQIVKFHGDFGDFDNKLILTEDSYFERLDFESELDIKFRSDVLEKTVIFMGYSFSDINMRYLYYKLAKLKSKGPMNDNDFPKSYIVSVVPNDLQEKLFENKGIEVINLPETNPKIAMEDFLEKLVYQEHRND